MGFVFDTTILELVLGAVLVFWLYYIYVTSKYTYWKVRSIAYEDPKFPFGTDRDLIFFKQPLGHYFQSVYNKFRNEKLVGLFASSRPYLMIRDPELLKRIMTKDFHHFVDRGLMDPYVLSPVNRHLFHMQGESWKIMRNKLIPAFTSGKMKLMFQLIEACCNEILRALEPIAEQNGMFMVKDFIACFTTDVIASCAFGLQSNSIKHPDNEFRENGKKIFREMTTLELIKQRLAISLPGVYKILPIKPLANGSEEFFLKIISDTIEYREKSGVVRNDFIDILIKIKNNRSLHDEEKNGHSKVTNVSASGEAGLTLEELTAQAVLFFTAGFETSASAISFCLYEISLNPEIQAKMRKEIVEVLNKYNGKPSYQALQDMTYLEAVINETLRRYASLPILNRQCIQEYSVPELNLVIPKGMKLIIPTYAIHHDPDFYPDPYKFDPERFTNDKIQTKNNYTFIPFGEGPRMCIGNRFAMMQMKMCLSMVLHNFELSVTEDTPVPIKIAKKQFVTTSESPIVLKISKRRFQ